MIVPTMNKAELAKEILNDYKTVHRKAGYLMKDCSKIARKRKLKEYRKVFPYKSLRRNDWTIIINYSKKRPFFQMVLHYRDKSGYNAAVVNTEKLDITIYSGHFLERYNQRFLKSQITSKTELALEFINRNLFGAMAEISDEYKSIKLFAHFNDGIGLGYSEKIAGYEFSYLKTFITGDMLHSGQVSVADITGEEFNTIWMKEFGHSRTSHGSDKKVKLNYV